MTLRGIKYKGGKVLMKSQNKRFAWLFGLCIVVVIATAESISAQTRPPLSPWLYLFNQNRSGIGLDNYHTYVAPQLQIQQEFAQQGRQIQQQQAQQRNLEGQIDKVLNAPKKRPSYSSSNGAGYRQYLHYYGGLPQGGPPYHGKR